MRWNSHEDSVMMESHLIQFPLFTNEQYNIRRGHINLLVYFQFILFFCSVELLFFIIVFII